MPMKIFPIKGVVQHYAWGGKSFIPNLLGVENGKNQPFAELWMGTHHRGTAIVEKSGQHLSEVIAAHPKSILGDSVSEKFGHRLPYLFKVLDVQKMLSIQTHPTKAAAELGFKRENEAEIPLTAFHRNYKDDNHKPEVMVALTDFWLLHGFQSLEAIDNMLKNIPEFQILQNHFQNENVRELYQFIMEMPQEQVDTILAPLEKRLKPEFENNQLEKSSPDYWAAMAFQDYTRNGHYDRGIFSIYLYNLVKIEKGKGIFQAAGVPHAYLEGVNMELMANSDNVFRGGLTPKHIDVRELLQHLVFEPVTPKILNGKTISETETVFPTPAPDFQLSRIDLKDGQEANYSSDSAEILIVMEGKIGVKEKGANFIRKKGEVFFVAANTIYSLKANSESILFKAAVT